VGAGRPARAGFNFYTEQFLALVLGEAMALAFLVYPGRLQTRRERVPWWDWLLCAAALAAGGYAAVRYPDLSTEVSMRPRDFLPLAVALALLVLETTRRSTGMSLIWYTAVGVAYAS